MPTFRSHKLIALLLIVTVGHLPVPWMHDHARLAVGNESAHLRTYHVSGNSEAQAGWHIHFTCLGLDLSDAQSDGVGDSSQPRLAYSETSPSVALKTIVRKVKRRNPTNVCFASEKCGTKRFALAHSDTAPRWLDSVQRNGSELYYLYCSMVI